MDSSGEPTALPGTPTVLGPRVPRRGNAFSRWLARLLLRLLGGYRLVGNPPDAAKCIVTAAPHTSNMDGLLLVFGAYSLGFDMRWALKHTMFTGIRGAIFRWTGAIPVNRTQPGGMVQQVLDQFRERDSLVLVIAPEGTRNPTDKWKSGFHRIALKAGVPICLGFIDYEKRLIGFGPSFMPTSDYKGDLLRMLAFYRNVTPRYPGNFVLPGDFTG